MTFPDTFTTNERQVARLINSTRAGLTREQIAYRTGLPDRTVRQAIEEIVASGFLPVICDRSGGGEGRYRVATPDDLELVNREVSSLNSYGLSALRRAKGLRQAYQELHQSGGLFLTDAAEASAA